MNAPQHHIEVGRDLRRRRHRRAIDTLVYDLYGVTEEGIKVVEGVERLELSLKTP